MILRWLFRRPRFTDRVLQAFARPLGDGRLNVVGTVDPEGTATGDVTLRGRHLGLSLLSDRGDLYAIAWSLDHGRFQDSPEVILAAYQNRPLPEPRRRSIVEIADFVEANLAELETALAPENWELTESRVRMADSLPRSGGPA